MSSSVESLALQVLLPGFRGTSPSRDVVALLEAGLAGVCIFADNVGTEPGDVAELTRSLRSHAPAPVIAIDEEGGDVTRLHARTGSPMLGHAALGVVDDVATTAATAAAIGTELAQVGVNLALAPVADVNSNPDNPVIGVRSFGAEPTLVARHVAAWVDGLQSVGVAACAKHFPGHGDTADDSHLGLPRVEGTVHELMTRELVPFAAAVKAGVAAVMTAHLLMRAVDPDRPATMSPQALELLRSELGFEGVVVSDALDMAGASQSRGVPAAAVAALRAGCDLLCLGPGTDPSLVIAVQEAVVGAVRSGGLDQDRLAVAASRVRALSGGVGGSVPRVAPADDDAQLAAARTALQVDGELPSLTGALLVRIQTAPSIAVGGVPWGLPAEHVLEPGALDTGRLAGLAGDRPVVLQVRDAHRHPEVGAAVGQLATVVVVEYGWPAAWDGRAPRICSHGASLPSCKAVAELLERQGWVR